MLFQVPIPVQCETDTRTKTKEGHIVQISQHKTAQVSSQGKKTVQSDFLIDSPAWTFCHVSLKNELRPSQNVSFCFPIEKHV